MEQWISESPVIKAIRMCQEDVDQLIDFFDRTPIVRVDDPWGSAKKLVGLINQLEQRATKYKNWAKRIDVGDVTHEFYQLMDISLEQALKKVVGITAEFMADAHANGMAARIHDARSIVTHVGVELADAVHHFVLGAMYASEKKEEENGNKEERSR